MERVISRLLIHAAFNAHRETGRAHSDYAESLVAKLLTNLNLNYSQEIVSVNPQLPQLDVVDCIIIDSEDEEPLANTNTSNNDTHLSDDHDSVLSGNVSVSPFMDTDDDINVHISSTHLPSSSSSEVQSAAQLGDFGPLPQRTTPIRVLSLCHYLIYNNP